MLTASQIATNIVSQLWLLDPGMSAEIGTPERNIMDTVAEVISGSQVDFTVLNQKHDLDAMTGGRLDAYLGNFGFGRQQPRVAAGNVTFSRATPALEPITIPAGTQLVGVVDSSDFPNLIFVMTETVTLTFGSTSVDAPVMCTTVGTIGNLPSNAIQNFGGLKSIIGITSITNTQPMKNGLDGEDDAAYKIRFKNTLFRNMSGTYDHILALAVAAATVSKANVVGPVSRYQEYVQVPGVSDSGVNEVQSFPIAADATSYTVRITDEASANVTAVSAAITDLSGAALETAINALIGGTSGFVSGVDYVDVVRTGTNPFTYTVTFKNVFGRRNLGLMLVVQTGGTGSGSKTVTQVTAGAAPTGIDNLQRTAAGGYDDNAGTLADPLSWPFKLTTALSTIPYSKYAYPENSFLTNGTLDPGTADFYRPFVDWAFNARPAGHKTVPVRANTTDYVVGDVVYETHSGTSYIYVAVTAGTSAGSTPLNAGGPHASAGVKTTDGTVVWAYTGTTTADSRRYDLQYAFPWVPNVTVLGDQAADGSPLWPLGLEPGEIALFEHQYMSKNSRNNFDLGILNCIDVFVNGGENRTVSSVQVVPGSANNLQNSNAAKWTYQKLTDPKVVNFRRKVDGRVSRVGNRLQPLYWQPVLELPDQITIGEDLYLRANYYNTADGIYYNKRQDDGSFLAIDKAHYAMVEEVNGLYGTTRARNGIEWFTSGHTGYSVGLRSVSGVLTASGNYFVAHEGEQFDVAAYVYDENIGVSQSLQDSKSQVTNDILVHRAYRRYFKCYLTIMYSPGATQSIVNASINAALAVFFENQFFGAAIQLSDILQAVHNVPGVDNVRWTADTTPMPDASELKEWKASLSVAAGQYVSPSSANENGYMYFVTASDGTAGATEPTWPTALGATVTLDGVTYKNVGLRVKVEEVNINGEALESGHVYFMNDFFIEDRELAYAPIANVSVISKRAQNTWTAA